MNTEERAGTGQAGERQTSSKKRWPSEAPWTRKKRTLLRELMSFVIMIVVAVFVTAAVKLFVIDIYEVPTGSMSPTISVSDRIVAEKITVHFGSVEPGDIVTFYDPLGNDRTLVKRVIAVAGQTVDLREGFVYVDNVKLDEPYTLGRPSMPLVPYSGRNVSYPYTVPEGHIWVMGDNRTDSADSRYFGSVELDLVIGKAVIVLWPPQHFGKLK